MKDAAELGALLSLGSSGPFRADIVIADKAMSAAMAAALDAVSVQLRASAPDAAAAYGQWRTASLEGDARPDGTKEVRLAGMFGRPVIVVGEGAGAKAAGLFSSYWDKIATSPLMIVQAADAPSGDASAVSLKYLGGKPGSFEVLANADWIAAFDIGAVAANGRLPATLVLDVAASPSAARTPPVATVFLNDILLGARQLDGTGKAERITAPVPRYSLAARNVLRVSFTRQLASDRCRETPTAYPVSVLPSSHLLLDKVSPSDDFTGMVSRYAAGAHVIVPASYLADAEGTLPRVVRLAATVSAIENIRLDLLRLQMGSTGIESVTASLDAARQIGQQISASLDAQQEVERLLRRTMSGPLRDAMPEVVEHDDDDADTPVSGVPATSG